MAEKEPLKLVGTSIILEEISPTFFPYVIKWRNDKTLNRYLNHTADLTPEAEEKWYFEKYLRDPSQGFLIIIDKNTGVPIGTQGWTDFDPYKRQLIEGRLLLADKRFQNSFCFIESFLLMADYLYQFVDTMYTHAVIENESSLKLNYVLGYGEHDDWEYPSERIVNGMEQKEFYRTKKMYEEAKRFLTEKLEIQKWPILNA